MAASLYIVVCGEDPGFDIFVNGRALARNEEALEKIARMLEVSPLLDFFSADQTSMELLMECGAGDPAWAPYLPKAQWFAPEPGLTAVRALLAYIAVHPTALGSETEAVARELRQYEHVLLKVADRKLQWHLAVSWN